MQWIFKKHLENLVFEKKMFCALLAIMVSPREIGVSVFRFPRPFWGYSQAARGRVRICQLACGYCLDLYPLCLTGVAREIVESRGCDMSDTAERVKKIVVEHLGVDADKVTEGASFIDDLGADSLDTVELVMAFEEEFGVEIPDDAAETILTVGDAVKFIDKAAA